jgi:autotransporter-associated beta strand protein
MIMLSTSAVRAITVSNLNDSGPGSLRDAINQTNAAGSGQINIIAAGVITLQSALPVITFSGDIFAYGATTISGNGLYRPFFIDSGSGHSLSILDLTITGGLAHGGNGGTGTDGGGGGLGAGGAIFVNSGAVTLTGITTQNSVATGGNGGSFNNSLRFFGGGGGGGLGGNGGNGAGTSTLSGAGGGGGGFLGNGGAGGVQNAYDQSYQFGGGGGGGGKYFDGGYGLAAPGGGGGGSTSAGSPPSGGIGGDGGTGGGGDGGADDSQTTNGNGNGNPGATGGGGGGAGTSSKYTLAQNNGGNGGKFGGGGGANNGSGGAGGDFGGGGGSGATPADPGGAGGFGGGGGGGDGTPGAAGFGGGAGGGLGGNNETGMGGAGGSAYGGAIFVRSNNGASISIDDSSVDAGTLTAGTGGTNQTGAAGNGKVAGSSIFLPSGTTIFSNEVTETIYGSMADDASDGNSASINKTGTGTLILQGNNTYASGTTISAGTLQIGNNGGAGSITGNVTDNANLTFDRSDTVAFAGAISGSGSLTQSGTGTLTITQANTYTGGTSIQAGTLDVVGYTLPGGNISVASGSTLEFDTGSAAVLEAAATITGTGTLKKVGSGILYFGENGVININLSSGAKIDVEAGLMVGSSNNQVNWSSNYASLNIASGAIFEAAEGGTNYAEQFDALTGAGTLRGGYSGNPNARTTVTIGIAGGGGTFSGPIIDNASGHLAISKSGSGTEIFAGTDTYTGGTTINLGTLEIGAGATGSIVGNVADNATLGFNRSDSYTFTGNISGSGVVNQDGTGTLSLTGTNSYAGTTTINHGVITAESHFGTAGVTLAGGGLRVSTSGSFSSNISTGSIGGTYDTQSFTSTVSSNITGNATLTKIGGGTMTITGTVSSPVTISAGTLEIGVGTTGSIAGNVVDNATLGFNRSNAYTIAGNISGSGAFDQDGTATLTLTGSDTYTGGTNINSGTLQIGNNGTVGSITGNITDNSALIFNRSNATHFSATISGSGTVTKAGSGTLNLPGTNTYSGGTTVSAGTLIAGNASTLGSGSVTVDGGAMLQFVNSLHGTLVVPAFTVQSGGTVDLGKTDLLINYTGTNPYTTTLASMKAAYDGGKWDGVGIGSSALVADTSLAIYDNSINTMAKFDGIAADSSSIFIKYTWIGDANFDGSLNADDYALLDRGFAKHLSGWTNGDFNYDGNINSQDYLLIDTAYLTLNPSTASSLLAARESQFGAAYVQDLLTNLPEPSLPACVFAAFLLFPRRPS